MTFSPEDRRPALRPPQFGLSTLLGVVAAICTVLAVVKFVGPIGAFALVLLILSVAAHISGNALGTRLRDNGDRPVDGEDRPLSPAPRTRPAGLQIVGPTRLTERRRMGLLFVAVVIVAVGLGAGGGTWWTLHSASQTPPVQDLALAAAAFGVLGGIWGLIAGGFVVVGVGAWREALQGSRRSDP